MITLIRYTQTFSILETERSRVVQDIESNGDSILSLLQKVMPGFTGFSKPTVVIHNGEPRLKAEWSDTRMADRDILVLAEMPQAFAVPYIIAAVLVASVAIAFLMRPSLSTTPDGDSVYTIKGRSNQIKMGDPIEVVYGRCRRYPAYASSPYNEFWGNDQYLYALFCIGAGSFDVEQILIDDTPIEEFGDVYYQVYQPGQTVTLFRDNVITSLEVNSIELLGPNQTDFEVSGPFVVNASGTFVDRIDVDIVFPAGLYSTDSKGRVRSAEVTALFEYLEIDDEGTPVGSWTTLVNVRKVMSTPTAQRFTYSSNVPAGRYMVRGQRTSNKPDEQQTNDQIRWESLRGYAEPVQKYDDVTTLAVKIRATYQLNDSSAVAVNCWVTRKLPTYDINTGQWTGLVATRSPAWAVCDAYMANYGGHMPATKLDLPTICSLAEKWETAGRHFDYTFDQKTTVWEAAKTIVGSVRAVPIPAGSVITLVEDKPKSLPTAVFGPHNMVAGSFKWSISLPKDADYDGVRISYVSPDDFLEDTVICLDGDDAGDNLEEIQRPGVTDRNWAYRDGLYLRRQKKLIRETFSFETGLEGHLPLYGSLIAVGHDLPRWSQYGLLLEKEGAVLTLSEPVSFTAGVTNVIAFRQRDGSVAGPFAVAPGEDSTHVQLVTDFGPGVFVMYSNEEPPVFLFGTESNWMKKAVVSNIEPGDESTVMITCYAYVDIFYGDGDTIEDPVRPPRNTIPDIPVLDCSTVHIDWVPGSGREVLATWAPALGAFEYETQRSFDDGDDWEDCGTVQELSTIFHCQQGETLFRIRPIGKGVGEWCTSRWTLAEVGDPWDDPGDPGTYDDLNGGIGGTPVGTIAVEARGGAWSLCGHGEITRAGTYRQASDGYEWHGAPVVASVPPRRYRRWAGAGTVTMTYYYPGCVSEYPTQPPAITAVGAHVISADTCDATQNDAAGMYLGEDRREDYTRTSMAISVDTGGCIPVNAGYHARVSGSQLWTLTDEDTDDDAIARLIATDPAWARDTTGIRTIRATGVVGLYRELRYRTEHTEGTGESAVTYPTLTGMSPWWRYRLTVNLERRPVDEAGSATGPWEDAGERTHLFLADIDGEGGVDWQTVEPPAGYELRVADTLVEAAP